MTLIKWHFEVKGIAVELEWNGDAWRALVTDANQLTAARKIEAELIGMGAAVRVHYCD